MTLKIVDCEEPTIISFCQKIKKEDHDMKHSSIEESRARRSNSLVLGKIVKVISFSTEAKRYILLVKEFLPTIEYGGKFKAVVEGGLARRLACFSPQTGDRLAFFEPFIFLNPAYEHEKSIESKKQHKYVLNSGHGGASLMWFTKKQEMGGKSDDEKRVKQARSPEKSVQHNNFARSRQVANESASAPRHSIPPSDGKSKKPTADVVQTSESVRQKPLIQLPQKPQIPLNTKRLNPHYKYKTISSIKSSDLSRSMEQSVNFFGIVNEITKTISTTKKNKFMLQCVIIDDSDEDNGMIKFFFFMPDDTIIKQIEVGDIVRLHRVKLELYGDQIDGRVFFSQDVVLFKKDCPDLKPITAAKNTLITDDDKERVKSLKKWYFSKTILLSDICQSGKYNIFCKVVMQNPKKEGNTVKITVTDGSAIKNLVPAKPLQRYNVKKDGRKDHIVTEIIAHHKLDEYARLKVDDFVLFCDVEAVPLGDYKLRLEINTDTNPEVSIDKRLQVADIECRIEQFRKSLDKNIEADNKNNSGISDQEDGLEIVWKGTETSVQTRRQKNKQKSPQAKNIVKSVPSACDNKSCLKLHSGMLNTKDDNDSKHTESDPGTKSRKQLFTPNYRTDLSDATDETSEHNLEMPKHLQKKLPDEDVVNPANTSFNDIVEKVKTKYCTPKTPGHLSLSHDEKNVAQRSSNRKMRVGNKSPVVVLEKLSGRYSDSRKKDLNISESQEDIEDAETVINMSCQPEDLDRSLQGNKRKRLESLSTEEGNPRNDDAHFDRELESRGKKVASWLFHPNNKIIAPYHDDIANDEFDVPVTKRILGCDSRFPDMSKHTSDPYFRIQGFLLQVIPDPSLCPLDLVSGYCLSGCQQMFLFSTMKWLDEETSMIPLCPECPSIEQEKELQLMFMMELHIMDATGRHGAVIAVRDQAEQFLNCTVADFVRDEVLRKSRVQLLTDYTMQNTYRASVTPMLDIQVCPMNRSSSTLVLANSTLKLPRL